LSNDVVVGFRDDGVRKLIEADDRVFSVAALIQAIFFFDEMILQMLSLYLSICIRHLTGE
jgi:hypothetical protein